MFPSRSDITEGLKSVATAFVVVAGFVLWATSVHAAPPTIAQSGGWYEGAADPITRSLTLSEDKLIVYVEKPDGDSITVTWNGDAMTSFGVTGAGGRGLEGFELTYPDTGTHDLVLDNDGSGNFAWAYVELAGTYETMSAETVTTGAAVSKTVTDALGAPTSDELEIAAVECNNPVANITVSGGNTKLLQVSAFNDGGEVIAYGSNAATTFTNGASSCTWSGMTSQISSSVYTPGCVLNVANAAATVEGQATIYAKGTCANFFPDTAWIGAVRIDALGPHLAWSEGYGPFPDPYELETTDGTPQPVENGTWRVRMYAKDGSTTYVSGYMDVVIYGNPYTFLTDTGTPADWELDPDDQALSASSTGEDGYYFNASTTAIVAAGGLVITPDGCAAIGENATSTTCVVQGGAYQLQNTFPLLSWPFGIFQAFFNAKEAVDSAPTTYSLELPSHGDWIPAVVVVDSASRTKGIGAYIPVTAQEFFRSILTFAVWVAFVYRMKRYADRLL